MRLTHSTAGGRFVLEQIRIAFEPRVLGLELGQFLDQSIDADVQRAVCRKAMRTANGLRGHIESEAEKHQE